ncbi:MAG: Metallo-dependent phosphatase-like protein [Benjaminiella poitrasii]|nr:MAG: Metallo-dependent phosphatase-like protein [Benjaminiella poitrasii]
MTITNNKTAQDPFAESIEKAIVHLHHEHNSRYISRKRLTLTLVVVFMILSAAAVIPTALYCTQRARSGNDNNDADLTDPVSSHTRAPISATHDKPADANKDARPNTPAQPGLQIINSTAYSHPPHYAHAVSPYSKLTYLALYNPSPSDSRLFVMGDVHGCLQEMNDLLTQVRFQPAHDVLILAGDMVFRGEDSIGVIRRARELGALCVRGNHDDKVIRLKSYEYEHGAAAMMPEDNIMPEGNVGDPLKFGNKHAPIARNLSRADYDYLVSCPLMLEIPSLNVVVVHGGVDPAVENLTDNDPWSVMNMRDMNKDNEPTKEKLVSKDVTESVDDGQHWTTVYEKQAGVKEKNNSKSTTTVVYGHDASRGLVFGNNTIGMDSGCVYGRKLSIYDIKSKQLNQLDCINRKQSEAEEY